MCCTRRGRVARYPVNLAIHCACAIRCTVLTLTPCAAGRDHAHAWPVLLAEIGQDRAYQSGRKDCCSP